MWNPFEKRRLRKDWRLVNTLTASVNWVDINGKSTGDKSELYYYLSENGLGERKCETNASDTKGAYKIKKHPQYLEKIVPWIMGRYDPDIPSYESIKAKEFKDALAGKVT